MFVVSTLTQFNKTFVLNQEIPPTVCSVTALLHNQLYWGLYVFSLKLQALATARHNSQLDGKVI